MWLVFFSVDLFDIVLDNERGPLRRVPHSCNGRSLSRDGSHTGEVVLCLGFVEQALHEHMSDEYKKQYVICTSVPIMGEDTRHHRTSDSR